MSEMAEFEGYVSEVKPEKFYKYREASFAKRLEFLAVLNFLHVPLHGIKFLDLGAGYGDCLDVCYEHGARSAAFTELDPFFFAYNRLKKYTTPYRLNHLLSLHKLRAQKFDLIWVKGSVRADYFVLTQKLPINRLRLRNWLAELESLASDGANIVICPHWKTECHRRKITDIINSTFTTIMLEQAYQILPEINGHTHEPEYPISFHKLLSSRQPWTRFRQTLRGSGFLPNQT